eukprot:6184041-Pleurochrysis_carterae.AAC.1
MAEGEPSEGKARNPESGVTGGSSGGVQAPSAGVDIADTRRGRHDRTTARSKRIHHQQAGDHYLLISKNTSLGQPCEHGCINKGGCGYTITKNELYACHERSYGTT